MNARAWLLVSVLLIPFATAVAEDAPPEAAVPTGLPVQLDGRLAPGEWEKARVFELEGTPATLRMMQFRGTLLVAFESRDAWIDMDELILSFAPNEPAEDLGQYTKGAVTVRYEPFAHDRAHLIVRRMETMSMVPYSDKVVARAGIGRHVSTIELAIPLTFLGLEAGKETPLRFMGMRARAGAPGGSPTWPAKLDVRARAGAAPADVQSSARWGRLTGLTKAGGPGAISPAAWKKLVEEAQEITRRGSEAHMLMREMEEEKRSFRKQDTLVDEQIFGNLLWIAEREPLGDVDRLLMAKAHRFVNRHDEALAAFEILVGSRRRATATRALYEMARTYRDAGRFEEEAQAWDRLAERTGRDHYRREADRARALLERWNAEAEARKADAMRVDAPLIEVTTNRGSFVIQLYPHDTPKACDHFISLVKEGFYNGLRFHRALAGYLAQCGDPTTRDGDCSLAGKVEGDRKVDVENNERRLPWRGAVCFARKAGLYANGSHFFVLTGPRPDLVDDSKIPYTLFGWVVSGMDVVDRLEWCDTLEHARVLAPAVKKAPPPDGDKEQEK